MRGISRRGTFPPAMQPNSRRWGNRVAAGIWNTVPGGFEPTSDRSGVPCYFDDNPDATNWTDVTGDEYVASAQNIGGGAPQGVNCSLEDYLDGTCLNELESYIESTGGS